MKIAQPLQAVILIRIEDQILVERGSAETRAKAQAIIMSGEVYVEGKQVLKSGLSFLENSKIIIKDKNKEWVSRGSYNF